MLFCQAYPVKKMVPLDRIASANPCLGQDFQACPLFQDVLAKMRAHSQATSQPVGDQAHRTEVFR
jgi:hypothetical protein